ncbi:MAG: ABC transporter ATP-binding protein, partial [Lachnospiraceae bacterium]|nr:ABC transporter ATP-binding protein [Lachnospiraceae bacterium]
FVISSGGSGMKTYRRLQKADIPFAAGILYENDIDFQLARLLAVEVVSEKNLFSDITDETYKRAAKLVSQVETVYNCGVTIGTCNRRIQDLLDQARKEGKLTEA